jgi:predicted anti-sigma-YlaC factor YlaD
MKHYTDDELIDYLHGEAGDAADARIHGHLEECSDCRQRYDSEASIGDMLRASALAAEREFPGVIRARVWASIREAEPTLFDRIRAFVTPAVAVPLAAMFALLMYFGVPVLRGASATGPAPTVAVTYYLDEHAAEGQENPLADRLNTLATLAAQPSGTVASAPLIDAADAATLDNLAVTRE